MKKTIFLLIFVLLIQFFLVACNESSNNPSSNEDYTEPQNSIDSNNETEANTLTEEFKREIYKALVAAEDKATLEADELYPSLDTIDDISKNQDKFNELTDKYKEEVRNKYGISEKEQRDIVIEGLTNSWPMD